MRKNDLKKSPVKEGLADLAQRAESDHEVQMARAELYKLAKYSIKLHEMLKGVSEQEGLEGWVQSKITKAADYLGSVYHHLDYETKFEEENAPALEGADYKHTLQKRLQEKTVNEIKKIPTKDANGNPQPYLSSNNGECAPGYVLDKTSKIGMCVPKGQVKSKSPVKGKES